MAKNCVVNGNDVVFMSYLVGVGRLHLTFFQQDIIATLSQLIKFIFWEPYKLFILYDRAASSFYK